MQFGSASSFGHKVNAFILAVGFLSAPQMFQKKKNTDATFMVTSTSDSAQDGAHQSFLQVIKLEKMVGEFRYIR